MRNGKPEAIRGEWASAPLTSGWRRIGIGCPFLAAVAAPGRDEPLTRSAVTFNTLVKFDLTDGASPTSAPLQGDDGNLYGTTIIGGTNDSGMVFKMTPSGTLNIFYNFCSQANRADSNGPSAPLVRGTDGSFYGITESGGTAGFGTAFKVTSDGTLNTIYNWCSQPNCTDGYFVFLLNQGSFVQAADGNFYGATSGGGGANGAGAIFKITRGGKFTTLYAFCSQGGSACTDGGVPFAPLTQGADGNLYGTTTYGGNGTACLPNQYCGTLFRTILSGALTTVYNFCSQPNCSDGGSPTGVLVQAIDRSFYGTTQFTGANGNGAIFGITSDGTLSTLYSIQGPMLSTSPANRLTLETNGSFYGTTIDGGVANPSCFFGGSCGTVFSLATGLVPFVEAVPTFGKVGNTIQLLGNKLTDATSVTFNGTAAAFTVASPTLIEATVPAGATSGRLEVVTPTGTLKSNPRFVVSP